MRPAAAYWIKKLHLAKHEEGGFFAEVYRSDIKIPATTLPASFNADRNICTSIYFLLQQNQFSAFHKIKSDELWHFYYGDPLIVYEIDTKGILTEHQLGNDPEAGHNFQCRVKAGNWLAAKLLEGGEYGLTGCTVSPGFDFADFELAKTDALIKKYPQHEKLIRTLS